MVDNVYGSNTIKTSINKEIKVSDLISLNPTSDKGVYMIKYQKYSKKKYIPKETM